MTETSKQYALALFSLATDDKQKDEIYKEFHQFVKGLEVDTKKFFLHPKIENKDKQQVVEKVTKNSLLTNFLKTVVDNNRFDLIEEMLRAYKDLLNDSKNIAEITIYTQKALSDENKNKLINKFTKVLDKKIIINEVINPSIVGGVRIEYQGRVLDQTINASLEQLKASLIG
ncbi:MAG: ATP synthase F1 subunit delta [Candidatus Izemoplasmatales bacterium]